MGDTVRLTVADNGTGFDPSSVSADHLGLKIMRERRSNWCKVQYLQRTWRRDADFYCLVMEDRF
jgi:nitrate/nitrite-specific signal transduction histidine kinase